jgi:hypothetical protein
MRECRCPTGQNLGVGTVGQRAPGLRRQIDPIVLFCPQCGLLRMARIALAGRQKCPIVGPTVTPPAPAPARR